MTCLRLHNKLRHRVWRRTSHLLLPTQYSCCYLCHLLPHFQSGWAAYKSQEGAVFSLAIISSVFIYVLIIELYNSNLFSTDLVCKKMLNIYLLTDWMELIVLFCICNFSDFPAKYVNIKKGTKMDPSGLFGRIWSHSKTLAWSHYVSKCS